MPPTSDLHHTGTVPQTAKWQSQDERKMKHSFDTKSGVYLTFLHCSQIHLFLAGISNCSFSPIQAGRPSAGLSLLHLSTMMRKPLHREDMLPPADDDLEGDGLEMVQRAGALCGYGCRRRALPRCVAAFIRQSGGGGGGLDGVFGGS